MISNPKCDFQWTQIAIGNNLERMLKGKSLVTARKIREKVMKKNYEID